MTVVRTFEPGATVADLRLAIYHAFDPPLPPSQQRLIFKGQQLPTASDPAAEEQLLTTLGQHAKVMLVATTDEERVRIETAQEREAAERWARREREVVSDFDSAPTSASTGATRPRNWQRHEFGFEAIETLPGLPQEDTARRILEELAADPGILAVMKKVGL
jgi:hypothetical protein